MKASIDIGSNTILLLVGEIKQDHIHVIEERQYAPRLGKNVDAEKNLAEDTMHRAVDILKEYQAMVDTKYPMVKEITVLATSAVRDAGNRSRFADLIKQETGFDIRVLSGKQEAELTFLGAQSVLDQISGEVAVIDIGGGSTELARGQGTKMTDRHSFNMGSVRFTERYLSTDPPSNKEIDKCGKEIRQVLERRAFSLPDKCTFVGVSGTATSFAAIALGHQTYQPEKLNGKIFDKQVLNTMIGHLSQQSAGDMLNAHPNILEGRADVFLAGLLILKTCMDFYNLPALTVSTGGIRHGALLD